MNDDQRRAERLRNTLTTVADRHDPDADAWAHIHDRTRAGALLTEVTAAPASRRSRARLLTAAAVLVAIAAVGAAVLVTKDDDTTNIATTTPEAEPTGWYVPVGLPDGWSVISVSNSRSDDDCPCRDVVWADADRSRVVIAGYSPAPEDEGETLGVDPSDIRTFELGEGTTATRYGPFDGRDSWDVEWTSGGQRQSFTAIGIPADEAEPIARALLADPDTADLPVSGLAVIDEWREAGRVGRNVQLDVLMQAPSGNPIDYTLSAPRSAVGIAWSYEPTDRLPGQPLATLGKESGGPPPAGSDLPTMPVTHDFLGRWPGATVRSAGFREGSSDSNEVKPTDAEVATLMSALRPATTEEWRRFVNQAGNRDRTVTASATLADLIDGVTSSGTAPGATTTIARETGTTAVDETATTAGPSDTTGSLADLELTVTAEPRLATWEDAGVQLAIRNPTASPISDPTCALDHAEVALVPADAGTRAAVDAIPAGDPWWSDDGACDGGLTIEPGASKSIRLITRAQFHDSRYGPLPSGTYAATVRIAGLDAPEPAPVEIGGETCSSGAEDYVGLTEVEARALAGERLVSQVRLPEPGTESDVANDSDDCNRINLIMGDDGRVAYARAY